MDRTLTVTFDCEHTVEWGETPDQPGAALPAVGDIAYCPVCECDSEITDVSRFDTETVTLETSPLTQLTVFYSGAGWGYCLHGTTVDGLGWEGDDVTGFESAENALQAGRDDHAERAADAAEMED
jgi:hypothetical protein